MVLHTVKKKGGKHARRGKKATADTVRETALITKDKDQDYMRVTGMLGDCRIKGVNSAQEEIICIIRGKFRKRVWINNGDIVLVGLRAFQDDRADVIHKYSPNEAKQLVNLNEIPRSMLGDVSRNNDNDEEDGVMWNTEQTDRSDGSDNSDSDDEEIKPNEPMKEKPQRNAVAPQREYKDINNISDDEEEVDDLAKALEDL